MGILDIFKKKAPSPGTSHQQDEPAPGWDAITSVFEAAYPGQTNPVHRAPLVYRMHDLSENAAAFDGVSAYDAGDHWHLVTYGLTELYGKENKNSDVSGFEWASRTSAAPRGRRRVSAARACRARQRQRALRLGSIRRR